MTPVQPKGAPKRGGWGPTIALSWREVQQVHEVHKVAAGCGVALNHMITAHAPGDLDLKAAKRWLTKKFADVGQALQRRGYAHVGLTVFERPRGAEHLHAHHLLSLSGKEARTIAWRFADGNRIEITSCHDRTTAYVTKQRQPLSPGFDWNGRLWRREAGDYIPGARLSVTKALRDIVPDYSRAPRRPTPAPRVGGIEPTVVGGLRRSKVAGTKVIRRPEAETVPSPQNNPLSSQTPPQPEATITGQLPLPLFLPMAADLLTLAEERRQRLGLSQERIARQLGFLQAQWSNAVVRRHDRLSSWAANRLRDFVAGQQAA